MTHPEDAYRELLEPVARKESYRMIRSLGYQHGPKVTDNVAARIEKLMKPGEELTAEEVAERVGCAKTSATSTLCGMARNGAAERVGKVGSTVIWRRVA